MADFQPIETAPRDGTVIGGWSAEWPGVIRLVRWGLHLGIKKHAPTWITTTRGIAVSSLPTHWIPVPPLPGRQRDCVCNQPRREGMNGLTKAASDVLAERARQINVEGWTPEHDDEHGDGAMAVAAACYALADRARALIIGTVNIVGLWQWTGWSEQWFKPKDKRRNLVRAAALLLAEIERMDRADGVKTGAAAQLGPPTAADEWRAPPGVETSRRDQIAAACGEVFGWDKKDAAGGVLAAGAIGVQEGPKP